MKKDQEKQILDFLANQYSGWRWCPKSANDFMGWGAGFDIYLDNRSYPGFKSVCVSEAMACPKPLRGKYCSRSGITSLEAISASIEGLLRIADQEL